LPALPIVIRNCAPTCRSATFPTGLGIAGFTFGVPLENGQYLLRKSLTARVVGELAVLVLINAMNTVR